MSSAARNISRTALAVGAVVLLGACGGGSDSPTSPSGGGGGTGASGATITIGSNGAVSPAQVSINVGQSVTFVNNDTRLHDMTSNPHPSHTDCPPMNAVGNLSPGQTKITNAFTTARSCGFHDHNLPQDTGLQGTITIR
ncbi:MAG: hypothetical protein M3Q85_07440 [Acidobacteriota bacterium]|nr:hypothetical protein [Acidobacteriota bacterium]